MDKNIKNAGYSNIFDAVMESFDLQLKNFFPADSYHRKGGLDVVQVENDSALADIARKRGTDVIKFPFFAVRYTSIEESPSRYNQFLLRFDGILIKSNAGEYYLLKLQPIKVNLTINFLCKDIKDVRLFSQRWIDVCRMHFLNFDLIIFDNPITIRVTGDPNVSFPDLDITSDTGGVTTMEVTASLESYMGQIVKQNTIKRIKSSSYQVYEEIGSKGELVELKLPIDSFIVPDESIKNE